MRHSTMLDLDKGFGSQSESLNSLDDLKFGSQTLAKLNLFNTQNQNLDVEDITSQLTDLDIDIPTLDSLSLGIDIPTLDTPSLGIDISNLDSPNLDTSKPASLSPATLLPIAASSNDQTGHDYGGTCGCGHCGHGYSAGLGSSETAAEFNAGNSKWAQPGGRGSAVNVTYSFAPSFQLTGLSRNQSQSLFREALGEWAAVAPINFQEIRDPGNTRDVGIRVQGDFIDGRSNTLAFAFFPRGGDQTYDTGDTWSTSLFLETAVHETGHSLGLGHESGTDAIMNPSIQNRFNGPGSAFLLQDDINGIRSLYGSGRGSVSGLNSPPPAPTPTPTPTQINGTGRNDTLLGTAANETIRGFSGNDLIRGSAGRDTVIGDGGNDTLFGGDGNDRAFAGRGNDVVFGSRGNDRLAGGEGSDRVVGGSGRDTLIGVFASEAKPGAGEIDILTGEQGPDTFVLGDDQKVYYADDTPLVDYALVRDFNPSSGDVLQLEGRASDYSLGSSPRGLPNGTTITYEGSRTNEIIAIIQGTTNFSLNSNAISYV